MNIKQALKQKNKLVNEINQNYEILKKYNSIDESNERRYRMNDVVDEINRLTGSLIDLKTKIHKANQPVFNDIFRLSELKNAVKQLQTIPTTEGKYVEMYGTNATVRKVELTVLDIDKMVKEHQEEIDRIQDSLDLHNLKTEID